MRFTGQLIKIGDYYLGKCQGQVIMMDATRPSNLVQTGDNILTGDYHGVYTRGGIIRRLGDNITRLCSVGESYERLTNREVRQLIRVKGDTDESR